MHTAQESYMYAALRRYARVQEADHIRRNLAAVRETLKREEKEREIAMKILELREKGQPVPEDLIAAHGRQ
eukprot:365192-Chlamydomonas_euryale.AAC.10